MIKYDDRMLPSEDQTMRGMVNDLTRMTGYVDLRTLVDDKTVLKNPHKGWFIHYVDNGFRRPAYRDGCEKGDYFTDFPGLNHLYLRFDWSDIEKEKGVYDFSPLDDIINEWAPYGYRFSLRMVTFETGLPYATPKYVFDEGAKGTEIPGSGPQPDYGDPIYLKYLEKFVEKFAEKYDGNPLVEIVDIGSYGTWGEGHTACGNGVIYPTEVVKKHFDIHAKYFTRTFLLCNDDHIIGRMAHGPEEVNEMLDYADARGFGIQDDSICCGGYAQDCGYDTMRSPWAFDRLYKNAPACIEFEHYSMVRPNYDEYFRNGYTMAEALKNSHATFAGFHGNPRKWLANERFLTEYCANRLGYWFFITSAYIPELENTKWNKITLHLENRGWAPAYHKYTLKVKIGGKVTEADYDIRTLRESESCDVAVKPDLRGLSSGRYDVYVGLFEGEIPVKLAIKSEFEKDGYYRIAETDVRG